MFENEINLQVTGDAMAPEILEEDILTVDQNEMPKPNGKDLAVFTFNGEKVVCRYTKYGSQYLLLFANAPISVVNSDRAEILGKVVLIKENHLAGNKMDFA